MGGAEARLELLCNVISLEMVLELCSYCFFQDFGKEGEVGDGSVVGKDCRVQGGFFEEGYDDGSFKSRGNMTRLEGKVYGFGDQGTYGTNV